MYVWRFPLFGFAAIISLAVTLLWSGAALHVRTHFTNLVARAVLLCVAIVGVLLSPLTVHVLTEPRLKVLAHMGTYVDPSPVVFWSPAVAAVTILAIAHLLFPRRAGGEPSMWRVAFCVVVLLFITFNLVNWCAPGWCERFGFPLPYSWWSDAIVMLNGQNITAGFHGGAIAINIACLSIVAAVLARLYRRSS